MNDGAPYILSYSRPIIWDSFHDFQGMPNMVQVCYSPYTVLKSITMCQIAKEAIPGAAYQYVTDQ